jgi:glycerophosphoryl diester phosphodiesterase
MIAFINNLFLYKFPGMRLLLSSLLVVILFSACQSSQKISTKRTTMSFAKNKVIAHRGAFKKNKLPENSIAALQQAIQLNCAGVEFDVHRTADDSLVINHDHTFFGKDIERSTYAELVTQLLPNGERLPTLRAYLTSGMQQRHTRLVLEIKPSNVSKERSVATAEKVVAMVQELNAEKWITYISFDFDVLLTIKKLVKDAPTQYLNGEKSPAQLKEAGIEGADYHYSVFKKNPDWIKEAKSLGIVLNAWTVNSIDDMDWLLNEGFDMITTNEPELLLERVKLYQLKK